MLYTKTQGAKEFSSCKDTKFSGNEVSMVIKTHLNALITERKRGSAMSITITKNTIIRP